MKRFILHVGFHKTATSSIQQTLANNRDELEEQGYLYPCFQKYGKEVINHSIPFYSAFCKQPELYHINIKNGSKSDIEEINKSYLDQFNQYLEMDVNLIVSGEDISVLHTEALIQLQEMIVNKGFKLEVYCSVRKPYPFTCSELQERIKSGVGTLTNIVVPQKSQYINKLKAVFGDAIIFSSFEEDCKTELGPVNSFIERIGVDPFSFKLINTNEGFGNISTRFLAHLNLTHPSIVNGSLNPEGRGFFSKSVDNEKFLLNKKELATVTEQLDSENNKIKALLGEAFCDENYKTTGGLKLNLDTALKLIKTHTNKYTYKHGLVFVLNRRQFEANELIVKLEKDADIFRQLANRFKKTDIKVALAFIAAAKRIRPKGTAICALYEEISAEFIGSIKLGIGIVTYNRLNDLKQTIKAVRDNTNIDFELFVADDGSADGTKQWCQENGISCSIGDNKGVVRNKNRALYYLNDVENCDVTLLLEDDCRPNVLDWQNEWVIASYLWGHINYAHKRILNISEAVISGTGDAFSPYICKLVTGQCTGCHSAALHKIGYLDPRFKGYGAGHVEWSERFVFNGYNGEGTDRKLFPAINFGLLSDDAPTFKDETQLKKNQLLKQSISSDRTYRLPWVDADEKSEFLSELGKETV